ncbi:winged helix-turn-helix transcriptional regulator [Acinetobacter sp. ANC 4640]
MPPRVEYQLTELGELAAQQITQLVDWIEQNLEFILKHKKI